MQMIHINVRQGDKPPLYEEVAGKISLLVERG